MIEGEDISRMLARLEAEGWVFDAGEAPLPKTGTVADVLDSIARYGAAIALAEVKDSDFGLSIVGDPPVLLCGIDTGELPDGIIESVPLVDLLRDWIKGFEGEVIHERLKVIRDTVANLEAEFARTS
jgi:hypothetical protein